jgi:membrane-bound lytic murein transglycosylase B
MRSKLFLVCLTFALGCSYAHAFDPGREDVKAFIDELVQKHKLQRSVVESLMRNAQSKPAIIEAMTRPAEQVLPWFDYRERFLNEKRIDKGVEFWRQQAKWLERAEKDTGVPAETILGILGVETRFGDITGSYRVLDALATLGFDYPPRGDFFRNELKEFILLTREERIDVRKALGSYAGAIGAPQFMPSNYRKLSVDGDGNGRRDLWGSWPDIVMSIANYLQSHGWRRDEPVVLSATLETANLSNFDTTKIRLNETVASLREKGARFETTLADDTPAMLIVLEGRDGNEYRVGFHNFVMISRYNPRVKYSLAVHDLGEAIARAKSDAQR